MHRKFLYRHKFWAMTGTIAVSLALFVSCQSNAERDTQLFAQDQSAKADLQRANIELNSTKQISPDNFEKLKLLYTKYPNAPELAQSFKAALAIRQDWDVLEKLLADKPLAERSWDDNIMLGKVYIKLGRFSECSEIMKSLGAATSNDVEIRSLAAHAHFGLGELDEAAVDLDSVWNAIISQKRIDDINLRGLIYFGKKDYAKAVETLKKALDLDPLNTVAYNTLSRVYYATGDAEMAEKYRKETERAHEQMTIDENRKMTFVSLVNKLKTAWNERRYDEVVRLSQEMIPIADKPNKEAVYKYLAEAQSALGNKAAADAANAEAQKIKGQ
jgi:tetratricopeptide (TPR) repeat protein